MPSALDVFGNDYEAERVERGLDDQCDLDRLGEADVG